MAETNEELIAIGEIRRARGLKGEVHVMAFGETLKGLALPCSVVLVNEKMAQQRTVVLTECRRAAKGFMCRFDSVNSIEEANALRSWTIAVGRSLLPSLGDNRYYHFELVGMSVLALPSGKCIGSVIDVHAYPTTDAIEICDERSSRRIIPLKGGAIVSIDKVQRVITIDAEMLEQVL